LSLLASPPSGVPANG